MARRKSRRGSSSSTGKLAGGCGGILVLGLVVLLAVYFLFTGDDPAGLFGEPQRAAENVTIRRPARIGSGGDWWQVYFTDPGQLDDPENLTGTIPEILIEHIDNAQDTVHIAAFEFDLVPLADALIRAHQRGVEVLWITDDENGIEEDEFELGLFGRLEEAGIEVRDDGRSDLMHNKFLIFDGNTVWTGSTNLTENGNFRNNNNSLVINSPQLSRIYEQEFQEMWRGEFGANAPSMIENQDLTIDGTPIQVLFAAEDHVVSALIPLVESAEESIRFMAFSFTHDELGAAVLERADAGVVVQGIFETRGSETEFSELTDMYCAGVPVLQDGNPGTMHHKVIVIDGRIVVTGSANFSNNADRSNDENVLIIAHEDIAQAYLREFDRLWAEAEEPSGLDC